MTVQSITPENAHKLLQSGGAVLVDVRDADEHARERIAVARNAPLARIGESPLAIDKATAVVFHCRSGARTQANASRLASVAGCDVYLLEGGLDGWKRAGLPVVKDRRQPIEVMRQVQIAAGSLVLTGVLLGAIASPAFYVIAGFVGAGLILAGATGTCAMARVLRAMPWNRRAV
jgi:rhodanese-related sulfurtransferase